MSKKNEPDNFVIVAQNRKARHNYHITETIETGIILTGTEVKSLRKNSASLNESFATEQQGRLVLINLHIPEYAGAGRHLQHEPKRTRELLLKKRERDRLFGAVRRDGYSLVPVSIYFNHRGIAKISLGLGKGKNTIDKRDDVKKRDWDREKSRLLRNKTL